jgi:hypothetical protein
MSDANNTNTNTDTNANTNTNANTSNTSDIDINGKKVFFLYPTASVQNQIITELAQHEYEVYIIKNHVQIIRMLEKYPDSILFVNIDEKMQKKEWEKWFSEKLSAINEVKVGIFTSDTSDEMQDRFNKYKIPCGFTPLKVDMSGFINKIIDTLNNLNVKGRRKYLRASTKDESTAKMNMPFGGGIISGDIKDVSVVGISCVFDNDPNLAKNELVKNIQIRLQSMLLKVDAVVFGSRVVESEKIYVMIFTQRIDSEVKAKIRKYIQHNLQSKIDTELK